MSVLFGLSVRMISLLFLYNIVAAAPSKNSQALFDCVSKALTGDDIAKRIVRPSDDTYSSARFGNVLFEEYPAMVAYATKKTEIAPLVKCAQSTGYRATPRSGGHHFENWSALNGTLVIDLAHVNYISVSADKTTAVAGAGIRLGAVYTELDKYDRTWIAGICPTVGLGGYLGVGGYNMQMRTKGMAVDWVESAQVILADGRLVNASPSSHPDLWFAIRGGGTFGIIVEVTLKITKLPRSAMMRLDFNNKSSRYESVQKYLNWAPKQDPLFNSQLNLYSNRTNILGWYLGANLKQLQGVLKTSGLLDVPGVDVKLSDGCSTDNSRMYWLYTLDTCVNDATAHQNFLSSFNVVPEPLTPVSGATSVNFNEVPISPNEKQAVPWPRINLINKTYFVQKSFPLSDEVIKGVVDKSGELPDEAEFWTEMTSMNISAPPTTSAFAWEQEATALFRFEVLHSTVPAEDASRQAFMDDLDSYLLPHIGSASYAGYIDAHIKTNPYTTYYGKNVCKLVSIKKQYDPQNFFRNPFSIPPTVPKGVTC